MFGATGVTGRQVAAYLTATDANWAAAGRDPAKLERILDEVGAQPAETIAAELDDAGSLAAIAARARVVLNLVGPYSTRGRPVIAACVAGGAHYADLTGEIPFVREMIEEFDLAATEAGVKIVQVCGFEALPPDVAVLLAAESARDRWGEELSEVDVSVAVSGPPGLPRPSDLISGGTFQSMAEMVGHHDPEALSDPAALIADPQLAEAVRRRSPIGLRPRRDPRGAVIGPMAPAAFINPAVIHRTAALAAAQRGVTLEPFRYREGVALAGSPLTLPLRLGAAGALAGTQLGFRALSRARPGGPRAGRRGAALRAAVVGLRPRRRPPRALALALRRRRAHLRLTPARRQGRRRRAPRLPGDRADARRGGADARHRRRDAGARRLPDPGAGARYRRARALRAGADVVRGRRVANPLARGARMRG